MGGPPPGPGTGPIPGLSAAFPVAPALDTPAPPQPGPSRRSLRSVAGAPADERPAPPGRAGPRPGGPAGGRVLPPPMPSGGATRAATAAALPAPYDTSPGLARNAVSEPTSLRPALAETEGPAGATDGAARRRSARGSTAPPVRPLPDPDADRPGRRSRRPDDTGTGTGRTPALRAVDPGTADPGSTGVHYGFEDEPSLWLQWGLFVLQTLLGAACGLGVWLGFYQLWDRWPFYAAPAVGVAIATMLVVARTLRRRYGHELDLLTSLLAVGVGVVLTVLPAAFLIQPM